MGDDDDEDEGFKFGVDSVVQELQLATANFVEVTSDILLESAGNVVFSFIDKGEEYRPKTALAGDDGPTETRLLLKKPAKIREEVMNRNKQLLEGAFHGTLHLYVEYAGEHKYLTESQFRLNDRSKNLQVELEKKYPKGTFDMLGAGKYQLLPVYDRKYKKILEPQKLDPPPPPSKPPPKATDKDKEDLLVKDRQEQAKYERKLKRASRIAADLKDPKKAKDMLEDLTRLWREIKDLESDSTKWRANSEKDPALSDSKNLVAKPRGQLIRMARDLKELKEDKFPTSMTILDTLIENGADVNFANDDGFTALMFAARNGHYDTARCLLGARGIEVNMLNKAGRNALHYAALYAHTSIVQMLRGDGKVDRKRRDEFGMTPKDCAETEGKEVREAKQRIWNEMVYKNEQFKLVAPLEKTDKPQMVSPFSWVYTSVFGINDPASVTAPKEWKPDKWRVSKIPDPACKIDPMPESKFINRWFSASKKCGPPVKPVKPPTEAKS